MDVISRDALKGVYIPIATPFAENEDLDLEALRFNMTRYQRSGIRGYLALGSNGENKSLTEDERLAVVDAVVAGRGEGQVVMAGVMYEAQRHAEQFLAALRGRGADIALLQSPSYFKKLLTDDCLYRYFVALAEVSPVPVMIYNCPIFNDIDLSRELLAKLSEHPNIIGMKDSTAGADPGIMDLDREDFCVMPGSSTKLAGFVARGSIGATLSNANYHPELAARLFAGLMAGSNEAERLNSALLAANKRIAGAFGVPGVKAAMTLVGLKGGIPRRPYAPLKADQIEQVKAALADIDASNL